MDIPFVKKAALTGCLFLLVYNAARAQDFAFDAGTETVYRQVLNLESPAALAGFEGKKSPQHLYVLSLAESLQLLLSENLAGLSEYEESIEERLDIVAKPGAEYLFLRSELHLQYAFVLLKSGREFDAALQFRKAYLAAKELLEKYPSWKSALKTSGLLNVMIGSVPGKYTWILGLMSMEGSVEKGLDQLETLRTSSHPLAWEAHLWLSFIKGFVLQKPAEAVADMEKYTAKRADRLALFLQANLCIKNSDSESALRSLVQMEQNTAGLAVPYVHYLKGEVFLHKGAYTTAVKSYQQFLETYKGQNYIKDALYKTGICHWLSGHETKSHEYFSRAKNSGRENTEADRYAARNLEEPQLPSKELTMVRYFTDGGYYQQAKQLLTSLDVASLPVKQHQVEYFYRSGRLAHKMNDIGGATSMYLKTIELSGDEEWYFAPNACLMLGYIARDQQRLDEASHHFRQALSYRRHEYKNSIDSKARSALDQLRPGK